MKASLWIKIKEGIRKTTRCMCMGGMFLLLPMMLLTSIDVIGRATFAKGIPGTVEISEYMLAVLIFGGLAYTQQIKGHVRVSSVIARLPLRPRLIVEAGVTLLSLFIVALLVWQGWEVGIHERTVSDMLRIPQLPFRLLLAVGAFFLFLELLVDLGEILERLRGR